MKCGGFRFRSSSLLTDLTSIRLDGSDGSDGWDGWCSFSCTFLLKKVERELSRDLFFLGFV